MKQATVAHFAPLLALIRKVEARSDYDIVYLGIPAALRPPKRLTTMTVAEVMEWQSRIRPSVRSTAAGAYQFIANTLRDAVTGASIPRGALFDAITQDRLALWLLTAKRGVDRYLRDDMSEDAALVALAQEWASFPVPAAMKGASRQLQAGQSYYAGDGLNAALVSIADVRTALRACRALYSDAKHPTGPAPPPPAKDDPPAGMVVAVLIVAAVAALIIIS